VTAAAAHPWAHAADALWKTVLLYFLLVLLLRVTGKREIGTLSAIDLVGFIMLSEAALISIADNAIPLIVGVTPVLALAVLQLITSYTSLQDRRVRSLMVGEPSVVIAHGRINRRTMAELRYGLQDLLAALRAKNVPDPQDVEFAIMETSGTLSVIPKATARPVTAQDLQAMGLVTPEQVGRLPPASYPAAVVVDGQVDDAALARAGRDRAWLRQALVAQGIPSWEGVLLASVDERGQLFVQRAEEGGDGGA
jgi:uncharacterized membrane protein YcaP (DUF421 family)